MPNNYLSVLYQHIIQVENKNVGLKVEGHRHTIAPQSNSGGGHMAPLPPPPRFLRQCVYIYIYIYIYKYIYIYVCVCVCVCVCVHVCVCVIHSL